MNERSMALVTGAAGVLGRAFAGELAERGYDLYLTDVDATGLERIAVGLERAHRVDVLWHAADMCDEASQRALYNALERIAGRVSMVVNVAGLDFEGEVNEVPIDRLRRIVRVNVESTLATTRTVVGLVDGRRPLRVVNVSSLAAFYPMPSKATYAASKAFVLQFTRALDVELRAFGGSATALCPAGLRTREDAIASIEAQGLIGRLTTIETPAVVHETIDAVLAGRTIVIPGLINKAMWAASRLIPGGLLARLLAARWKEARTQTDARPRREAVVRSGESRGTNALRGRAARRRARRETCDSPAFLIESRHAPARLPHRRVRPVARRIGRTFRVLARRVRSLFDVEATRRRRAGALS